MSSLPYQGVCLNGPLAGFEFPVYLVYFELDPDVNGRIPYEYCGNDGQTVFYKEAGSVIKAVYSGGPLDGTEEELSHRLPRQVSKQVQGVGTTEYKFDRFNNGQAIFRVAENQEAAA